MGQLDFALGVTGLFVLLLGLYNLLFVNMWHQGHWYFPLSVLFASLFPFHRDPGDEVSHDYFITGEKPPFARKLKTTADVTLLDEGWAYTGEESFTVASIPGRDLIVAKRYDAVMRGTVRVYVDGVFVGEWEFPERQFQFGEDLFVVPASFVTDEQTRITFEFVSGSSIDINSFHYWIFVSRS